MVVLQQQGDREVIEKLKTLLGKRLGLPLRHYQALDRRIPLCLLDLYLEQHVFRSLARDALGYNVRCFTSKGSSRFHSLLYKYLALFRIVTEHKLYL